MCSAFRGRNVIDKSIRIIAVRIVVLMKTLMEDDEWKQEFLERSEKFEKRYPKMIRFGFLGMIIIPLIFLILMFSLESKLVFLVLWIVSLIALAHQR